MCKYSTQSLKKEEAIIFQICTLDFQLFRPEKEVTEKSPCSFAMIGHFLGSFIDFKILNILIFFFFRFWSFLTTNPNVKKQYSNDSGTRILYYDFKWQKVKYRISVKMGIKASTKRLTDYSKCRHTYRFQLLLLLYFKIGSIISPCLYYPFSKSTIDADDSLHRFF